MFMCERCGSSYSAHHIGVENCPRCQLRDRVQAPLTFKMFKLPDTRPGITRRAHRVRSAAR
jgi:hypothetical protein